METTKKTSNRISKNIEREIQEFNKAKYRKRSVKRIKEEMKIYSQKTGKPFRNIDLARELGLTDGSLVSKWFSQDHPAEIKDYHLQAMADLFQLPKSWLDGSGDAREHESYNSIIKKTGLSESAIEELLLRNGQTEELTIYTHYPDQDYIDAINYLFSDGNVFLEAFAKAKAGIEYVRRSKAKNIDPLNLSDDFIDTAIALFGHRGFRYEPDFVFNSGDDGLVFLEDVIVSEEETNLEIFTINIKNMTEGSSLTNEEVKKIYRYCQDISAFNTGVLTWNCTYQLSKLFAELEKK